MAYTQNNPFSRKTSSPLNNISGLKNLDLVKGTKTLVDYVNQNDRIDPNFNPENINRHRVVDQHGNSGDKITGGYEGVTDYTHGDSGVYRPDGASANLFRSGDVYANNMEMQENMSFDPEKGYSPRMLNIHYDKREDGNPYSAYIDNYGPGGHRSMYNRDQEIGKSLGRRYNLTNRKEKAEFEKARLTMYNNQMNMVNRANSMYKIADPEKYLNYYQDERTSEPGPPRNEDGRYAWQEEMYGRDASKQFGSEEPIMIGAPGSNERANYLRMVDERYNNHNDH